MLQRVQALTALMQQTLEVAGNQAAQALPALAVTFVATQVQVIHFANTLAVTKHRSFVPAMLAQGSSDVPSAVLICCSFCYPSCCNLCEPDNASGMYSCILQRPADPYGHADATASLMCPACVCRTVQWGYQQHGQQMKCRLPLLLCWNRPSHMHSCWAARQHLARRRRRPRKLLRMPRTYCLMGSPR